MSFASLEREVFAELKAVLKNPKFRKKDIMEWSTSKERVTNKLRPGERLVHCPKLNVWCAVKEPA